VASPSIFISYSSIDVKIAEAIENHLGENGFDEIWRDKSKIRSGWSKEIANALSKSDIILLIWSENSSRSQWVKNEWLTARALAKPIQLVIISALDKFPTPLANLDAIVFDFMKIAGTSEKYQNNNRKALIVYSKFLGPSISFYEIENKSQVISFLDTKIKNSEDDPDKRWITTWNDYLVRIKYFCFMFTTIFATAGLEKLVPDSSIVSLMFWKLHDLTPTLVQLKSIELFSLCLFTFPPSSNKPGLRFELS
jgi:hypothetical protein